MGHSSARGRLVSAPPSLGVQERQLRLNLRWFYRAMPVHALSDVFENTHEVAGRLADGLSFNVVRPFGGA